jgi:hypothetical protein
MIITALIVFAVLVKFELKYKKFGLDMKKVGAYIVLGFFTVIIMFLTNIIMVFLSFFVPTFLALGILYFVSTILPKK